jgi:hypothetical protein
MPAVVAARIRTASKIAKPPVTISVTTIGCGVVDCSMLFPWCSGPFARKVRARSRIHSQNRRLKAAGRFYELPLCGKPSGGGDGTLQIQTNTLDRPGVSLSSVGDSSVLN